MGGRLASTRCSTAVEHDAAYVLAFCDGGYTTNLPLEDVTGGKAWVAFAYDGEPLDPEHGGPARLLVPHLYFWKSAKWVRGLALRDEDEPGFWETLRLPHLRRPVAGAALLRATELAARRPSRTSSTRRRARKTHRRSTCPDWPGHRAGQHVDVRLTAEDGYQAERSYSIASAPGTSRVAITVERLDDGEVSPYLVDELRAGDELELRGPIGGYFVWERGRRRAAAPRRRRLGHRAADVDAAPPRARAAATSPCALLYSSRTLEDVIYRDELEALRYDGVEVVHTLTRAQPRGLERATRAASTRAARRGRLAGRGRPARLRLRADELRRDGRERARRARLPPARVKTERFGATGRKDGAARRERDRADCCSTCSAPR